MASTTTKVDFKSMEAAMRSIQNYGLKIDSELFDVYVLGNQINKYWSGQDYNDFVRNSLNKYRTVFINFIEYCINTLPKNIDDIKKAYQKASKVAQTTKFQKEVQDFKKISGKDEVIDTNAVFKANKTKMKELEKKAESHFKKVNSYIDSLEKSFNNIAWQSSSASDIKKAVKTQLKTGREAVSKMQKNFAKNINEAIARQEAAEKAAQQAAQRNN